MHDARGTSTREMNVQRMLALAASGSASTVYNIGCTSDPRNSTDDLPYVCFHEMLTGLCKPM